MAYRRPLPDDPDIIDFDNKFSRNKRHDVPTAGERYGECKCALCAFLSTVTILLFIVLKEIEERENFIDQMRGFRSLNEQQEKMIRREIIDKLGEMDILINNK